MITITPQGQIYLCKTPLENDYKNQLTFTNLQAQINYFNSVVEKSFDNYTYIKKDNQIKVGCNIDEIISCNYLFYKNTGFTNKYYFCFITNMQYINENCTLISFETDCFQTWQFDINYKRCFVEREHVSNDTIGLHTIDENLNVGEVKEESYDEFLTYGADGNDYYFCINTTYNPFLERDFDGAFKINGNLSGNYIYCFDVYEGQTGTPNVANFIYKTASDNKIESIQDVYILPKDLIDNIGTTTRTYTDRFGSFTAKELNGSDEAIQIVCPFYKTKTFSDYTPKNKKCFCYPYNYLLLSNNVGNQNIYKYEDFEDVDVNLFEMQMAVSVGGSIRIVPKGYKNMEYNYDESIPLAKFPTCSWSTDSFINWLTANAVNIGTQIVELGASVVTGNIASTSLKTANLIGEFREAVLKPNITGGNNTGDVNFAVRKNSFILHHMRAKTEYLRQIDDYFSMFGYKINLVKIPNITGRRNWNYVKTIECNFAGNIPQTDLNIIKTMFNSGVTLWHNPNTFLDYSQNNNII